MTRQSMPPAVVLPNAASQTVDAAASPSAAAVSTVSTMCLAADEVVSNAARDSKPPSQAAPPDVARASTMTWSGRDMYRGPAPEGPAAAGGLSALQMSLARAAPFPLPLPLAHTATPVSFVAPADHAPPTAPVDLASQMHACPLATASTTSEGAPALRSASGAGALDCDGNEEAARGLTTGKTAYEGRGCDDAPAPAPAPPLRLSLEPLAALSPCSSSSLLSSPR